ncbi:MAG: hypothetical protein WDZ54_11365 [Sneathiella sp.]
MVQKAIEKKFLLILIISFVINLAACATERTAAGDPIEKGTVEYGISAEERVKLDSIPISIRLWQDKHIRSLGHDPNDARIIEINLEQDLQSSRSLFIRSFEEVGDQYVQQQNGRPLDYKAIDNLDYVGRIHSGFLDLNFAIFLVEFKQSDKSTKISVLAIAFEGLIKQNTIGAAIERLTKSMEEKSGGKINWQ